MNNQGTPVAVVRTPFSQRPFMHGTKIGGIQFTGHCLLLIIGISFVVFFVGFVMAAAGYNNLECSYGTYRNCGYEPNGVRKTGIVFTVFGGAAFIIGIALAFKAHGENKMVRGLVVTPVTQGPYQSGVVNAQAVPFGQGAPAPVQGYNSNVPGYGYMNAGPQGAPQQPVVNEKGGFQPPPPPYAS